MCNKTWESDKAPYTTSFAFADYLHTFKTLFSIYSELYKKSTIFPIVIKFK